MCMQCKAIVHHRCNIRLVFFEELTASSKILKEGIPQNSLRIPGGGRKRNRSTFSFLASLLLLSKFFSKVFPDQHFSGTKYFSKHFFTPPHVGMEFLWNSAAFSTERPKPYHFRLHPHQISVNGCNRGSIASTCYMLRRAHCEFKNIERGNSSKFPQNSRGVAKKVSAQHFLSWSRFFFSPHFFKSFF